MMQLGNVANHYVVLGDSIYMIDFTKKETKIQNILPLEGNLKEYVYTQADYNAAMVKHGYDYNFDGVNGDVTQPYLRSKTDLHVHLLNGCHGFDLQAETLKIIGTNAHDMIEHTWLKNSMDVGDYVFSGMALENTIYKFEKFERYSEAIKRLGLNMRSQVKIILDLIRSERLIELKDTELTCHYFLGNKSSQSFDFHNDPFVTTMVPLFGENETIKSTTVILSDQRRLTIPLRVGSAITIFPEIAHQNDYLCESGMLSFSYEKYWKEVFK